jgi:F0F1-type ATP synthase membrane subunit b/b'
MELNITIFIQALIFLMLFIFSSQIIFKPLRTLFLERSQIINHEKQKILTLKSSIKEQKYHIKKTIFLIKNKVQRQHRSININNVLKEKEFQRRINFQQSEKYKNSIFKLKNEIFLVRKKVIVDKNNLTKHIMDKLSDG